MVFLTGRDEIDRCLEELSEYLPKYDRMHTHRQILLTGILYSLPRNASRLKLLALHAGLTTNEQLAVFEPAERGTRKVIVSTNIAEVCTSIKPFSTSAFIPQRRTG